MSLKYQIISYIPAFGISKNLLHHHWTSYKISNFLFKKLFLTRRFVVDIMSSQQNLHKKTEIHPNNTDNTTIYLEYISRPNRSYFKVISFFVIYE